MLWFYLTLLESPEDEPRFIQLYNKYEKLMYNRAYNILKNRQLSEDAVQNAFTNIARNFKKVDDIDCHKTKGYVIIIVENEAKLIYKRRNRFQTVSFDEIEDTVPAAYGSLEALIDNLSVEEILVQIRKLHEDDVKILILRCVCDYEYDKIAKMLYITSSAARKRLERAKIRLTALCEKEGVLVDKKCLSESEAETGVGAISD